MKGMLKCFGGLVTAGLAGYNYAYADWWRDLVVENYVNSQKPLQPSILHEMKRKDFDNYFLRALLRFNQPVLIKGFEGCGKSFAIQQYLSNHKKTPSAYLSLSQVSDLREPTKSLAKQFHYIGTGFGLNNYKESLSCLKRVLIKVQKKNERYVVLCIDDIHRTLPFGKDPIWLGESLITTLALDLVEKGVRVILISSNNSARAIIQGMSGMHSRLNYIHFPKVKKETYLAYLEDTKSSFGKSLDKAEDREAFYNTFGSSFRKLEEFMYYGTEIKGNT